MTKAYGGLTMPMNLRELTIAIAVLSCVTFIGCAKMSAGDSKAMLGTPGKLGQEEAPHVGNPQAQSDFPTNIPGAQSPKVDDPTKTTSPEVHSQEPRPTDKTTTFNPPSSSTSNPPSNPPVVKTPEVKVNSPTTPQNQPISHSPNEQAVGYYGKIRVTKENAALAERVRGYFSSDPKIKSLSGGYLVNATPLPFFGEGFIKLASGNNRHWGSREMISLITSVSSGMQRKFPAMEPLRIGDISGPYGGYIGHISHQNGLDADIGYYRLSAPSKPKNYVAYGFDEKFVIKGKVSPNFDFEKNWMLLKWFASSGWVRQFYMDPVLKKNMCLYSKSLGDFENYKWVLSLIEKLSHHDDHVHVRIRCPESSPNCLPQKPNPQPVGC